MTRRADRLLALVEALRRRPVSTAGELAAALPAAAQMGLDQDIFSAPQWVTRHAPAVDLLELKRAAQHRRMLRIDYGALNGRSATRDVRPLSIRFFGPVWLLVAWCETASNFRCFRLDRIRSLSPTGAAFRDEPGKRLADFKRIKGEEVALAEQR